MLAKEQSEDSGVGTAISAERGGGFVPFQSTRGHNLQHTAECPVTKIPGPSTRLKEELPEHLCSCCKIQRNHSRMSLRMVTLSHIHLWHWPQQMPRQEYRNRASTYETFLPLILSLQPLQAATGLPGKDKAEVISPAPVALWLAPHFCYVQRAQAFVTSLQGKLWAWP